MQKLTIGGVSRELLESFAAYAADSPNAVMRSRAAQLRALLDAPAKLPLVNVHDGRLIAALRKRVSELESDQPQGGPVDCAHEWSDDGEFTLTCTKCDKTENHEPYGWVQTRGNAINHFTQEWDVVEAWEAQGFEYKAMFDRSEHHAPVAVAMSEGPRCHVGVVQKSTGAGCGLEGVLLASAVISEAVKPGDKLYAAQGAKINLGKKEVGCYASLYDGPSVRRAYTYKHQPGNDAAHRIGVAAQATGIGGDAIDKGLSLLCELERFGLGVFEI